MLCKPCFSNRSRRDGGQFGLCWQHKKTKCRICHQLSAGKHYCINCEHRADMERWKQESQPTHFDDDHAFVQIQLRKERLSESKYHTHRAVEILFRAFVLVLEAIWAGVHEPAPKKDKQPELFEEVA